MKVKEKKCKGTGKAANFDGCKTLNLYRTYGLCPSCYRDWLLNTTEGAIKVSRMAIKVSKPRVELENAITEKKDKQKLNYLLTSVKNTCHKYIKLRDHGKPCVSCLHPWNSDHQAGHWKKAELYSSIKFNENNIHNQCVGCNIHNDGNVQQYADNIHLRIGEEGKAEVERLAGMDKKINFKWDREELIKTREYYKQKIKQL